MVTRFIILYSILSLPFSPGYSQPLQRDTAFVHDAIKNAVALYSKNVQGHAALYNGSEYLEPTQNNDQHPFFVSDDWIFGSLKYDGDIYHNVALLYDITSDKIVTEQYYNSTPIVLINQKVSWFSISGHMFERIQKEAVANTLPHTGFYEVLHAGATKIIARRQKNVQERIENNTIRIDFEEKNRYYLLKEGNYHSVKNKTSVLKLLEDQKRPLKHYIRDQKIRFKGNAGRAISALAKQYDALKNNQQ